MTAAWRAAQFAVLILLFCAGPLYAADAVDPDALMARIPAATSQSVWILDGPIRTTTDVQRWRLFVNDAPVFDSRATPASDTTFRVGLILRAGDNLIALESYDSATAQTPLARWTTHVYRGTSRDATPEAQGRQFAIVVQGDTGGVVSTAPIESFKQALTESGVSRIQSASSWEELNAALGAVNREIRASDQVLIYYSGLARLGRNTEPVLLFPKTQSQIDALPAGNLIRNAADLPSASVLLDVTYEPSTAPIAVSGTPAQTAAQTASGGSAAWLRAIDPGASVELAYTNPAVFTNARSSAEGFTGDFIRTLRAGRDADSCNSFARAARSVASDNAATKAAAWPLFFTRSPSSFRFCSQKPAPLKSDIVTLGSLKPALKYADLTIAQKAPASATTDVLVDGVPVLHQAYASRMRVPIGPGPHLVEIDANRADGAFTVAGTSISSSPAGPASGRWSSALTARIEPAGIPALTTEEFLTVGFIVGDVDNHSVRYELRNNGVVMAHDESPTSSKVLRFQAVKKIPLSIGDNNIVLDVIRDNDFSESRALVVRRRAQPISAVIVGVDGPAGGRALKSAAKDADRMRRLLLRYTDALPNRIKVLTNGEATAAAITTAISTMSAASGAGGLFVFYFAGYGVTVVDPATSSATRCIVTADYTQNSEKDCLSTTALDEALKSARRALVVVDTSYDGADGSNSRTYRALQAQDSIWRFTSGTDTPDRTFLVAGGSNAPAMESDEGGVFTLALEKAVRDRFETAGRSRASLPLADVYNLARDETSAKTGGRQVPVMKGVLSTPFEFVNKPIDELKQEALGIVRSARNDLLSMRAVDGDRLARAAQLYEKVLTFDAGDLDARQGQARAFALAGDRTRARRAVDDAVKDPEAPDARDWLSIRADLEMRDGQLSKAIADAERVSEAVPPRPEAAAFLGMLYAVDAQHEKSVSRLKSLFESGAATDGSLTDEEAGRALLVTYISLVRSGDESDARLMLKSFSDTYKGRGWYLKTVYDNWLFKRAFKVSAWWVHVGQNTPVQTPWTHLVAQYLRKPDRYETLLRDFRKDAERYDPRDESAFECLLHFYIGMASILERNTLHAIEELSKVILTNRSEFVEFWFAREELARLARR